MLAPSDGVSGCLFPVFQQPPSISRCPLRELCTCPSSDTARESLYWCVTHRCLPFEAPLDATQHARTLGTQTTSYIRETVFFEPFRGRTRVATFDLREERPSKRPLGTEGASAALFLFRDSNIKGGLKRLPFHTEPLCRVSASFSHQHFFSCETLSVFPRFCIHINLRN